MTRVWRVCKRLHADVAFTGEGASRYGGRWNPRGIAVVYTAETLSLALLEVLVHVDARQAPRDLVGIPVDLPSDATTEEVREEDLPRGWERLPAPSSLARIGAEWARSQRTVALVVPSVVNPVERNVLLNPRHPDFALMEKGEFVHVPIDPRLVSRRKRAGRE